MSDDAKRGYRMGRAAGLLEAAHLVDLENDGVLRAYPKSLADRIRGLIDNPDLRRSLGKRGRSR